MKRMILVTGLVAMLAGTAQAGNMATMGLGAGLTLPFGDLGDAAGAGFHIGGEYCYHMSDVFAVGGDLVYHKLGSKDVDFGTSSVESKFSTFQYGAHAKYMIPSSTDMHPHLRFGLGLYTSSVSAESNIGGTVVSADDSSTDFGFNFGGGADWKMNESMSWGVQGIYHYISTEGSAGTMISLGANVKWGISR